MQIVSRTGKTAKVFTHAQNLSEVHVLLESCWATFNFKHQIHFLFCFFVFSFLQEIAWSLFSPHMWVFCSELFMCCFLHMLDRLGLTGCVHKSVFNDAEIRWKIFLWFQTMGYVSNDYAYFIRSCRHLFPLHAAVTQKDNAKHTATYDSSPRHWRRYKILAKPNTSTENGTNTDARRAG